MLMECFQYIFQQAPFKDEVCNFIDVFNDFLLSQFNMQRLLSVGHS